MCPRCHAIIQPVVVHGHYQCQICKSNIDDCCSGEICQPTIEMSSLKEKGNTFKKFQGDKYVATITNFIAQNQMQIDIWIEIFKSQSAKIITDVGTVQISITKNAPNKAVVIQ